MLWHCLLSSPPSQQIQTLRPHWAQSDQQWYWSCLWQCLQMDRHAQGLLFAPMSASVLGTGRPSSALWVHLPCQGHLLSLLLLYIERACLTLADIITHTVCFHASFVTCCHLSCVIMWRECAIKSTSSTVKSKALIHLIRTNKGDVRMTRKPLLLGHRASDFKREDASGSWFARSGTLFNCICT